MQPAYPILELAYLPPVPWMAVVWSAGGVRLEACEHFQKGSYRNRCHIAGPNGVQRLSIPLVKGKHQQTPIREVRIAYDEPWQQLHWRSIRTAYGNAPYFEYYADGLAPFFEKRYPLLFDFNLELLHFMMEKMAWTGVIQITETYQNEVEMDFRNTISPKTTTLPDGIQAAAYQQVFTDRHGYLPGLSALDLLFCCGKQSGEVLQNALIVRH